MAEALGEMAALIARVESLGPSIDARCAELAALLAAMEPGMAELTDRAKAATVAHVIRRTSEITHRASQTQTRAMADAARQVFQDEAGPALQRLARPLEDVARLARHAARPWESWLTHAGTALSASALTWAAAAWFFLH